MEAVFIYVKDNKIKALGHTQANWEHKQLINQGYKHTATLDVCVWIEHICNNCEDVDLYSEIRELFND